MDTINAISHKQNYKAYSTEKGVLVLQEIHLIKTNFVFDLVSLDRRQRLLEIFFQLIFQKKRPYLSSSWFSNLFNASGIIFCFLSFAQSRKILSKFSKLSAILKHDGEFFLMMTSIVRLSFNRPQARTNQNARITWVIISSRIAIKKMTSLEQQ